MSEKGFALVTGASSGIGAEIAKLLAAKGYNLIVVARRAERLADLKSKILKTYPVKIIEVELDLSSPDSAKRLFNLVLEKKITVEILVNNAGVGMQGKFLEMDVYQIEKMFQLNMTTLTLLTLLFGNEMKRMGGGYILQVSSASAFLPTPYVSAYAATKAFVLSFSEALTFEFRGSGVSVTTLYPGITTTEFNEHAEANSPGFMKPSILTAEQVAKIGLRAMFKRRRKIVPGFINKVTAIVNGVFPRGLIVFAAGLSMKKANSH